MAQPCTKEGEIARHDERLDGLEKRSEERRDAEIQIFKKLEEINKRIGDLKTAQAVTALKIVMMGVGGGAIPAIVTLVLLLLTGKI